MAWGPHRRGAQCSCIGLRPALAVDCSLYETELGLSVYVVCVKNRAHNLPGNLPGNHWI